MKAPLSKIKHLLKVNEVQAIWTFLRIFTFYLYCKILNLSRISSQVIVQYYI